MRKLIEALHVELNSADSTAKDVAMEHEGDTSDANPSEAAGDTPFSKPVRVLWRRHTYAEALASVNFGLLVAGASWKDERRRSGEFAGGDEVALGLCSATPELFRSCITRLPTSCATGVCFVSHPPT